MADRIIFHKDTGKIVLCKNFSDNQLELNLKNNTNWDYLDGSIDVKYIRDFKVNTITRTIVEKPPVVDIPMQIRVERNRLLAGSDWTQMPDAPLSDAKRSEWASYRQALRDMPDTFAGVNSMEDITWPARPL